MSFPDVIKRARQRVFLSQEEFAQRIGVSIATINRWETGKVRPKLSAMKSIKAFCLENEIIYDEIEEAWFGFNKED